MAGSGLDSEHLSSVSHELRTPLNTIIGFAELLYDGKLGRLAEPHREYVGDILASAQHLASLIHDLVELARLDAGVMELHPSEVEIETAVREVKDALRPLAAHKHLAIDIQVDPAVATAWLDTAKLRQVLYTYLWSAVRRLERGTVSVRATAENERFLRIEVEDAGDARPVDLARAFDAEAPGETRRRRSTGLGLALSKRLVEAQGGQVGARAGGNGSVFFAVLPRVQGRGEDLARDLASDGTERA